VRRGACSNRCQGGETPAPFGDGRETLKDNRNPSHPHVVGQAGKKGARGGNVSMENHLKEWEKRPSMGDGVSLEWSRTCQEMIVAPAQASGTMGFVKSVLGDRTEPDIDGLGVEQ